MSNNGGLRATNPMLGLTAVRLVVGAIFIYHGYGKLFGGIEAAAGMFASMGIPAAGLMAWLVALVETLGGIALVTGVWARPAAVLLIPVMLVAILTVHLPHGFANVNIVGMGENGPIFGMPGWEFNLALIGGLLAIALGGPGLLAPGAARDRSSVRAAA